MTVREQFKEMFDQVTLHKRTETIPDYYHPEFLLYTNGETQDYAKFLAGHQRVHETGIGYSVEYDDDAWVESDDRVGGRMWITIARPDTKPTRLEVILTAQYRDGKLYRLWELTYPDWSQLQEFETY